MFACQVGRQLQPLPLPTQPCADHPERDVGMWITLSTAAFHLGMLLLPSPRGRGLGREHREGKSVLGTRLKHLGGGSSTTATSRSAWIWQGQASCCFGMGRGNQAQGSLRMEVVKAAGIPSWSGDGSQEIELLHGNTGESPARKMDSLQTPLNTAGMRQLWQSRATSRHLQR